MQAVPLTGRAAVVASTRVKLEIATLRAQYGATKAERDRETAAAELYRRRLIDMGEKV